MPTLVERFLSGVGSSLGMTSAPPLIPSISSTAHDDWPRLYSLMWDYYLGVGLYQDWARTLYGQSQWSPAMKDLRNPAFETVEFYPSHVWPGPLSTALPLETDRPELADAIRQIWTWSNWGQRKNTFVRRCAILGDGFLKVAMNSTGQRVYLQIIDPRVVTEFDTDERGFLTYIRLTDQHQRPNSADTFIRTEVWDKALGTQRIWETARNEPDLRRLGEPKIERSFEVYGIDFVPFVWSPFRDIGERRGMNAFFQQKEGIDELNLMATRLHQLLFRYGKPTTAILAGGFDANGLPLPTPGFLNRNGSTPTDNTVTLGDDDIIEFPGASSMEFLIPAIDWAAHLNAIAAQAQALERKLPETTYFRLSERGSANDLSGRAIRFMLGPAIKRVEEVRGNLEDALVRADMMALTIAQKQRLPGFEGLGTFEAGNFSHGFAEREVIPLSQDEKAAIGKTEAETAILQQQLGVSQMTILQDLGFDPLREQQLREVTSADMAEQMLRAFESGQ